MMRIILTAADDAGRKLLGLRVGTETLEEAIRGYYASTSGVTVVADEPRGTERGSVLLRLRAGVWLSPTVLSALQRRTAGATLVNVIDGTDEIIGEIEPAEPAVARKGEPTRERIDVASLDPSVGAIHVRDMRTVAAVEKQILSARASAVLSRGVRLRDPDRVAIRGELHCGAGVEIDVDVVIEGTVRLGDRVRIGANAMLIDATIGPDTVIHPYSTVDNATVGASSFIGPYGRVRPGSVLGDSVQIGNFVEIKKSEIGDRARINHLSFVGDATLATDVTLGAGTITCNHDRTGVARTVIGEGVYVGSGTELVAPITVGPKATIAAGSTVTKNVPPDKLTVARARQVTLDHWVPPERRSKK